MIRIGKRCDASTLVCACSSARPTGGWLKPDAADVVVQTAGGQVLPVVVLSHDPAGETIIQFKRNGNNPWYWAYGASAKPLPQLKIDPAKPDPAFQEGLTVEVREWQGDDLGSWARVHAGLKKSDNVIGNADDIIVATPRIGFALQAGYTTGFEALILLDAINNLGPGAYYIGVILDSGNAVHDVAPGNNIFVTQTPVLVLTR